MIVESSRRLLSFHRAEHGVRATGDTAHQLRVAFTGVIARLAAWTFRAHAQTEHCGKHGAQLHEERIRSGQRVLGHPRSTEVVSRNVHVELIRVVWSQAGGAATNPRFAPLLDQRILGPVSAQTDSQVVVPLARRHCHKNAVAVDHRSPEANVSDVRTYLLGARQCAAAETEICQQSLMHVFLF